MFQHPGWVESRIHVLPAFSLLHVFAGWQANLHALIQLKPALSHLGDKGLLLLLRWMPIVLLTTRAARRRRPSFRSISKNSLNSLLVFLLRRFLSIPKGFSYLNERGYVSKQLDKWQKVQAPQQPCEISHRIIYLCGVRRCEIWYRSDTK